MVNRKLYYSGLVLLIAGSVTAYFAFDMLRPGEVAQPPLAWVLHGVAGVLLILGLVLCTSQLAGSVLKRLKVARERNKANRDRQRQARRNKPGSTSQ